MNENEDYLEEGKSKSQRVDLMRVDFVRSAVHGLLNLGDLTRNHQRDLVNRLGDCGFNIASQDEEELEKSVRTLMELTNDCDLQDEQIIDFQMMEEQEREEWAAELICSLRHWNRSSIDI